MLRGTGGAMLALPYLDAMAAPFSKVQTQMRMACVGLNFGAFAVTSTSKTSVKAEATAKADGAQPNTLEHQTQFY